MSRVLLERYARLLTTDTEACARLFAPDAEYLTRLGEQQLHLRGRDDILRFITHVPRQLCFRATGCRKHGESFRGQIHVRGEDFPQRSQAVRYQVAEGLFKHFEVLHSRV